MNAVKEKDKKRTRAIVCDDETWQKIQKTADQIGYSTSALIRIMFKEYELTLKKRGLLN